LPRVPLILRRFSQPFDLIRSLWFWQKRPLPRLAWPAGLGLPLLGPTRGRLDAVSGATAVILRSLLSAAIGSVPPSSGLCKAFFSPYPHECSHRRRHCGPLSRMRWAFPHIDPPPACGMSPRIALATFFILPHLRHRSDGSRGATVLSLPRIPFLSGGGPGTSPCGGPLPFFTSFWPSMAAFT